MIINNWQRQVDVIFFFHFAPRSPRGILHSRENRDCRFLERPSEEAATVAPASPGLLYVIKHTGAAGV